MAGKRISHNKNDHHITQTSSNVKKFNRFRKTSLASADPSQIKKGPINLQ